MYVVVRFPPDCVRSGAVAIGTNIRVSQLIGMNIENGQGKRVGEVRDIVLDANSGRVRYMAVTYGGFLGVGNKMFAVPFEAFKCRQDPDDHEEYILVLDMTQQQLEGAAGFDEDHWPNFGDNAFARELGQAIRRRTPFAMRRLAKSFACTTSQRRKRLSSDWQNAVNHC